MNILGLCEQISPEFPNEFVGSSGWKFLIDARDERARFAPPAGSNFSGDSRTCCCCVLVIDIVNINLFN